MNLLRIVAATIISVTTAALASDIPPVRRAHGPTHPLKSIIWGTCHQNTNLDCADFEVPLDYQNLESGKTFTLSVIRWSATNAQPSLGSIFINPGGPGQSGKDFLAKKLPELKAMTGGNYDLISWDPRGVHASKPEAHCFKSASKESSFWANTVLHPGLEAPGNFLSQEKVDEFIELAQPADNTLSQLDTICTQHQQDSPELLRHVGTVATVRDMLAIHDAYVNDPNRIEPINFWGFSYGSLIGLYLVNLFPDRVGHVVLEGVVDPEYWGNKPPHMSWSVTATHIDSMLELFATACVERSSSCRFASGVKNHMELLHKLESLLNMAYDYKRQRLYRKGADISSSGIRKSLLKYLPDPSQWTKLSDTLSNHYHELNSQTPSLSFLSPSLVFRYFWAKGDDDALVNGAGDYSFQAITCGDAVDLTNVTTKVVFEELVRVARDIAPRLGPAWGEGGLYCHRWTDRAVERLDGTWAQSLLPLSKPILILGNTIDSVTPYRSAKKVAGALASSAVLVEQETYGHVPSWELSSKCTTSIVMNYLVNGTLPAADTTCKIPPNPFPKGAKNPLTETMKLFEKKRSEL